MAKIRQLALAGAAVGLLASCGPQGGLDLNNFDPDFRGWGGGGLDTANAAAQAMPRTTRPIPPTCRSSSAEPRPCASTHRTRWCWSS